MPGAFLVFSWPPEDHGWEGELLGEGRKGGAKEDFGRPAAGHCHESHAQGNEALGSQELFGCCDKFFGIQGEEIGLILVNLGLVSSVDGPGFLRG